MRARILRTATARSGTARAVGAPMIAGIFVLLIAGGLFVATLWLAPSGLPGGATAVPSTTGAEDALLTLALTANVYARPTRTADRVAIIPEGRAARLTGRTEDGAWLRVTYPPSAGLDASHSTEGWVSRASVAAASLPALDAAPVVPLPPAPRGARGARGLPLAAGGGG